MRPFILIGILGLALSACGIKGPLEMPRPQPQVQPVKTAPQPVTP
jgi:predicted small lipoprotein YifL